MSDLTKILAENQKMLMPLLSKKPVTPQNLENSDSEPENVFPNTSTPIKTKATTFKTTPVNSRNTMRLTGDFKKFEFFGIFFPSIFSF